MEIENTKTNITIPTLLWKAFRMRAKEEGMSVNDLLKKTLTGWLIQKDSTKESDMEKHDLFG